MKNSDDKREWCVAEAVEPVMETWHRIRDDVMPFQRTYFGLEEDDLRYAFEAGNAKMTILKDVKSNHVVGFTYAESTHCAYHTNFHPEREKPNNTYYVQNIAIAPNYAGNGLVWKLLDRLHGQLTSQGCCYIEMDAMEQNGFAAKIERHYHDAIVFGIPHTSRRGRQVYFRINLLSASLD